MDEQNSKDWFLTEYPSKGRERKGELMDCTDIVIRYREFLRHSWNTYFATESYKLASVAWERIDAYNILIRVANDLIFSEIVARCECEIVRELFVIPRGVECPIMVQREGCSSTYWDDPVNKCTSSGTLFKFLSFFDWLDAVRDCEFCMVEILNFEGNQHLIGRKALFPMTYATFVVEENGESLEHE